MTPTGFNDQIVPGNEGGTVDFRPRGGLHHPLNVFECMYDKKKQRVETLYEKREVQNESRKKIIIFGTHLMNSNRLFLSILSLVFRKIIHRFHDDIASLSDQIDPQC